MITALCILALVVVILASGMMVGWALNGEPFAIVWIATGGLTFCGDLIMSLFTAILEGLSGN